MHSKKEVEEDVPSWSWSMKLPKFRTEIVWTHVFNMVALHLASIYGAYLTVFYAKWMTIVAGFLVGWYGGLGITAGVHRLWAHRSFKARLPLQIFLMIGQTIAFESHIIQWARDHRCHHKWSDTDGDPHNSTRGFFFCHVGWTCMKKDPELIKRGNTLDFSDLYNDPLLRFQRSLWPGIAIFLSFVLPTVIPHYFWGETLTIAFFHALMRHAMLLNLVFFINSVAHMYGNRPYDETIEPRDNQPLSFFCFGEGWHNFHHAFPSDYRSSELPVYHFNLTTIILDALAWLGQVHSMKVTAPSIVAGKKKRVGDRSH